MSAMNQVLLMGNLGRDPEVRQTQNGNRMATLNLATTERYIDREGNRQEDTDWHRVVVFNNALVDKVIEPYLRKGSGIIVSGKLRHRKFEQDGQTRYITEVVVNRPQDQIILNGSSANGQGGGYGKQSRNSEGPMPEPADDEDIPF